MYWLKVRGGIDRKNVIPYGAIRNDVEEMKKRKFVKTNCIRYLSQDMQML